MTRAQVLGLLAAVDALPENTADYCSFDRDAYMRALDTLGGLGLLPVDVQRVGVTEFFERFEVGGVTFTSPLGFTPLTDRPAPLALLAARSASQEPTRRPLTRSDEESDAQVIPIRSRAHKTPEGDEVA